MKVIKVIEWSSKISSENGIKEIKENTLVALTALVNNKNPQEMPKGLDNFRIMNRISKAFDKTNEMKEDKVLKLETGDYNFLKNLVEKDIPATWGRNHDIVNAIDKFLNAEDIKEE